MNYSKRILFLQIMWMEHNTKCHFQWREFMYQQSMSTSLFVWTYVGFFIGSSNQNGNFFCTYRWVIFGIFINSCGLSRTLNEQLIMNDSDTLLKEQIYSAWYRILQLSTTNIEWWTRNTIINPNMKKCNIF